MRALFASFVAALVLVGTAGAASLDPARIAAIDQATQDFLAKAAAAKKTGMVPRQSDPEIAPLLDTVFDTRDLSHGAVPYADLAQLRRWLSRIGDVGHVYFAASNAAHDGGLFGPEMERYVSAAVNVMQAIADCVAAEQDAHPDRPFPPTDLHMVDQLRISLTGDFDNVLASVRNPGLSVGAVQTRLTELIAAAPSFARFLKPDQIGQLRRKAIQLAAIIREKQPRELLGSLAAALAAPAPPSPPSAQIANGSNEIALEADGLSYRVPVRINGAVTVKFIVDSGASVVVLPKTIVDEMTRSGAIAATDMLGRDTYVTADGKRHHGTQLMLRRLEVGGHTVTNIMANIAPEKAEPLLGLSFLTKFKSWTLDNKRHVLIVAE